MIQHLITISTLTLALLLSGCEAQTLAPDSQELEGATTLETEFTVNTPIQTVMDDPAFGDYGRLLFPTEGGYWSLDPTGAALAHLRRRSLPRDEVASVAGMSDGFWRAFARSGPAAFGVADPAAELARLTPERSRTILVRLRELEASDPDYLRFPRLKRSDDASLFWLEG